MLIHMFGLKGGKKNKQGGELDQTRQSLLARIGRAISGRSRIDEELLDRLEEVLVESDVGLPTTLEIISRLQSVARSEKYTSVSELNDHLIGIVGKLLSEGAAAPDPTDKPAGNSHPYVIMVVGVNGVGKTTTIGKLAHMHKSAGKKVILGAADTFRAAAVDQLRIWSARADVPIVAGNAGADPASVAFEAVSNAVKQNADVVIVDTAGRLHNKISLMNELTKIRKVMERVIPGAPHEVLLVLDASTGQNAIEQARGFTGAVAVNSLALTKVDGTARGGVVIAVSHLFKIPVKYIGTGEGMEDLKVFNPEQFARSLFRAPEE